MNALCAAALEYAQRGWSVFPLHGIVDGRCTCRRNDCSSTGKHPIVRRGLLEATTDGETISSWWSRWQMANIGVATGTASEIVVIDVDLPLGRDSLDRVIQQGIPPTLLGISGGGGLHLVYASDDGALRNSVGRLPGIDEELPGIDLRATGGYIVAPPSMHSSGFRYEWLNSERDPGPAPDWLKQPRSVAVRSRTAAPPSFEGDGTPYGLTVLRDELQRVRFAVIGTRNHQLNRSAFALAQLVAGGELLESAARSALLIAAVAAGLTEKESRQTIASAFTAGIRDPRVAPHRVAPYR